MSNTPMPTAAKLVSGIAFAALAFFAAEIFKPHFSESTQFGAMSQVSALIGLVCGWRVMGPNAGRGYFASMNYGVRASLTTVFFALVVFSIEEMVGAAFRKLYHGPLEAILGAVAIGTGFARKLLVPDMMLLLLVGGALCGLLAEWAARRWR